MIKEIKVSIDGDFVTFVGYGGAMTDRKMLARASEIIDRVNMHGYEFTLRDSQPSLPVSITIGDYVKLNDEFSRAEPSIIGRVNSTGETLVKVITEVGSDALWNSDHLILATDEEISNFPKGLEY